MNLSMQISDELKQLVGLKTDQPKTIEFTDDTGNRLAVDLTRVESMSCSFRELRLHAPALQHAGLDRLKAWAENLSQRITYLLEHIGPLECDEEGHQVLLRSLPPDSTSAGKTFYEMILNASVDGTLSLRRFRSNSDQAGREQVDIQTTSEVLQKLADDIVDTLPNVP